MSTFSYCWVIFSGKLNFGSLLNLVKVALSSKPKKSFFRPLAWRGRAHVNFRELGPNEVNSASNFCIEYYIKLQKKISTITSTDYF